MIFAKDFQHPVPKKTEDARDLQLRLYRDIGISAVAAALAINVGTKQPEPIDEPALADAPSVRRDDRAA